MIRHIVLFKMKKGTGQEELARLESELKGLEHNTDGLMKLCQVRRDIAGTPTSCELGLNSQFESMETLAVYRDHPNHVKVLETIKELCSGVTKIDFEE